MAEKSLTKLYKSYLVSKKKGETMQARYRYSAYRKAGGKRKK